MEIEINGFDESGNIGENLVFVRVCINYENLLRPYVYNLLHFKSLTPSKSILRGQPTNNKKEYLRMILDDPSIDVNFYQFPVSRQLLLMRRFMATELNKMYQLRGCLVEGFKKEELLYENSTEVSNYLSRYRKADKYIELLIKSYGHKAVIKDLQNTSKNLSHLDYKNSRKCKVISLVDGGIPFVFWAYPFLEQATLGPLPFSLKDTPIFGISKGDEYFPVINMAGNLASIANSQSIGFYPHNMKEIPKIGKKETLEFINRYREEYGKRMAARRVRKIFFIGSIPTEMQYTIPFMLYRSKPAHEFFEGFRNIRSFKDFRKEFGLRKDDFIIKGNTKSVIGYEDLLAEAVDYGLTITNIEDYFDMFSGFLNDIEEEIRLSNIDTVTCNVLLEKLKQIEGRVEKQLKIKNGGTGGDNL